MCSGSSHSTFQLALECSEYTESFVEYLVASATCFCLIIINASFRSSTLLPSFLKLRLNIIWLTLQDADESGINLGLNRNQSQILNISVKNFDIYLRTPEKTLRKRPSLFFIRSSGPRHPMKILYIRPPTWCGSKGLDDFPIRCCSAFVLKSEPYPSFSNIGHCAKKITEASA